MLTVTIQLALDRQGDEANHPYRIDSIHDWSMVLYFLIDREQMMSQWGIATDR